MRRNSNNSQSTVISTPVSVHKTTGLKFSRFSSSRKNSSNSTQFSDKEMTPPILTSINQPVTEIKQNVAKRFSLKVSPKIPKFIRSSSSSSTKSRISVSTLSNDNHLINQFDSSNKLSSSPTNLSTELPPLNSSNSLRAGNTSDLLKSSNEAQDTCSISENWEPITSNDYKNSLDENNEKNEKNGIDQSLLYSSDPIPNKKIGAAPLLISNIGKMSTSTTKAQKKNVKAGSKSLPKNLFRFIKKDKPPEIVTTPSLSPPSVSQFSYVSPPPTIPQKSKKKRGSRPKSGTFATTKQTLANALLRRVRNRPSSDSTVINGDVLTYTSFPDPDPEDFVNIYPWDLPDSISATEAAGGELQMIEYDGIYINGVRVN